MSKVTPALASNKAHQFGLHSELKSRVWLIIASLFFFLGLSLSYSFDIALNWRYYGFQYAPSAPRIVVSLLVLVLFSASAKGRGDATSFYQGFAILALLCPASAYYSLGGASDAYFFNLLVGLLAMFLTSRMRLRRPVYKKLSKQSILALMLSITFVSIVLMVAYGGLRYFNLNIMDVYIYRRSAAEWTCHVLVPLQVLV